MRPVTEAERHLALEERRRVRRDVLIDDLSDTINQLRAMLAEVTAERDELKAALSYGAASRVLEERDVLRAERDALVAAGWEGRLERDDLIAEREELAAMMRQVRGIADSCPPHWDTSAVDALAEIVNIIDGGMKLKEGSRFPGTP